MTVGWVDSIIKRPAAAALRSLHESRHLKKETRKKVFAAGAISRKVHTKLVLITERMSVYISISRMLHKCMRTVGAKRNYLQKEMPKNCTLNKAVLP